MCSFCVDNGDSILGGNTIITGVINCSSYMIIKGKLIANGRITVPTVMGLDYSTSVVNSLWVKNQSYINNIIIGTVITGAAGASATVTKTGIAPNAILNFAIPKGDNGEQGIAGTAGLQGAQGIQGVAGSNGAQGIQGVAGTAGKMEQMEHQQQYQ